MRVFLGWLRGERGHCRMVAIPTLEEEDAKRPSRERESLVGERTRIINRMKAALARLGIRGFNPELRKAPQRLDACARRRMFRSHRTRSTRSGATWLGSPWSANRSTRSNGPASRAWNRRRRRATCDGAPVGPRHRRGRRDGRHAGSGGVMPKPSRPTGLGAARTMAASLGKADLRLIKRKYGKPTIEKAAAQD